MSPPFQNTLLAERRRFILDILNLSSPPKLNHRALAVVLEQYGLRPADDALRGDLRWLFERGLITIEYLDNILIAALTQRGRDASADRLRVDGVSRDGMPDA